MTAPGRTIYFDHNATTAVAEECLAAMDACLRLGPINPSSKHSLGDQAKELVNAARGAVAVSIGAAPAEIVFTSGGTESNHLAILGSLALQPQRRHIISSEVEHPSTLMLLRRLETQGVRVSYLPVDATGALILDALADTLSADTALVTLMWANNETGVLFPIAQAAELSHARGALFHTDAVQAAGKLPIELECRTGGHVVAVRTQVVCTRRNRRAVRAQGRPTGAAAGRPSGARAARRHAERRGHRRARRRVRVLEPAFAERSAALAGPARAS